MTDSKLAKQLASPRRKLYRQIDYSATAAVAGTASPKKPKPKKAKKR